MSFLVIEREATQSARVHDAPEVDRLLGGGESERGSLNVVGAVRARTGLSSDSLGRYTHAQPRTRSSIRGRGEDSRASPAHEGVLPSTGALEDVPVDTPVVRGRLGGRRRRRSRAVDPNRSAVHLLCSPEGARVSGRLELELELEKNGNEQRTGSTAHDSCGGDGASFGCFGRNATGAFALDGAHGDDGRGARSRREGADSRAQAGLAEGLHRGECLEARWSSKSSRRANRRRPL